jgi:transcriptional regulator with GAF, ATPase, and Fis domain
LRLEDAGSANGVFVDERRLRAKEPVTIRPGQPFLIGKALLVVHQGAAGIDATIIDRARSDHPSGARGLDREAVARAPATVALFALVERVARGNIHVLVLGETGAGKELVAEAIHRNSPRRDKPFIRINCAALPEQLIESELFGHERGAFTGAVSAKVGVIEAANGGTVFLDEVGELTAATQAKLLRVIEAQEIQRLGAVSARRIDVRFVSATNRDLAASISLGAFRADLYYRLNGICLQVPPLRTRKEDVLPLAESFLASATRSVGCERLRLTRAAEDALLAHPWPGNVRELRNAVERAALLAPDGAIAPSDLGLAAEAVTVAPTLPAAGGRLTPPSGLTPPVLPSGTTKVARHDSERRRILDALNECSGNQTRAAKLIGMPRRTFVSKLSFFGIPRPRKL